MPDLGRMAKSMGTAVPCPVCRHPNLGIDIWCQRCGTPLDWNVRAPTASDPNALSPVVAPEPPEPPDPPVVQPVAPSRRDSSHPPTFRLPRLTLPAIVWPRLTLPTITVPRVTLPRVPRTAWVVAVVALLLIAPLLYVVVSSGRALAERRGASGHVPSATVATAGGTPQGAAVPGIEAKTGLRYSTGKCATNAACLTLASQTVGHDAAAEVFSTAASGGRECVGYVYKSGGRWQFLDAVCGLPGQVSPLVGHDATVHVPGNCANVRSEASLNARVVACLYDGTTVHIDGGPTYADGRVWWHQARGWMAHDFLTNGG